MNAATDIDTPATTETPKIFVIPAYRMDVLEKRVEKLTRKATKHGLTPITFEVVGEKVVDELDAYGRKTGYVKVFKLVELHGEAPVVAGYTFIARTEHTEAGNILSKAPGAYDVKVPAALRDGGSYCDHCNTKRRRKDTFIIREDVTNKLIRVGRNCLQDFIRDVDPAGAISVWTLIQEFQRAASLDDEYDRRWGSKFDPNYDITSFVAFTLRAIDLYGWVSKGQAYNSDEDKTPTVEHTIEALRPLPSHARHYEREAWENAKPTELNRADALKAIEWAKGLEGSNDYEHNLKVACALPYITPRNLGLVASVASSYRRHVERELAKTIERKQSANSTYVGAVGSRYIRKLQITKTREIDGQFGLTVLYTFLDEAGNVFKWWSSGGCRITSEDAGSRPLQTSDDLWFTFKVKRHSEYQGRKETLIERATPSIKKPAGHKWVHEATGEIFKTKKALRAASV